jgi:DNA-binding transcriptional regulator YiaG
VDKPTRERKAKKLPYQEPHGSPASQSKLLEEAIGREVKRFREKLGLTISELAKAADMSAGMLSKIENGATSPSLASLQALGRACRCRSPVVPRLRGNPRCQPPAPGRADHRTARHQGRASVSALGP